MCWRSLLISAHFPLLIFFRFLKISSKPRKKSILVIWERAETSNVTSILNFLNIRGPFLFFFSKPVFLALDLFQIFGSNEETKKNIRRVGISSKKRGLSMRRWRFPFQLHSCGQQVKFFEYLWWQPMFNDVFGGRDKNKICEKRRLSKRIKFEEKNKLSRFYSFWILELFLLSVLDYRWNCL